MAVTYPGYNYGTNSVVGGDTPVSQSTSTAGTVTAAPGTVSVVPQPPTAAAAAAAAAAVSGAYPVYGGVPGVQSGVYSAYGMATQVPATPVAAPLMTQGSVGSSANKQSELQERILNLMKGPTSGGVPTGVPAPSGVPAPTGVPPPSGVPAPSMVPQPAWPAGANKAAASSINPTQSAHQGQSTLFAAYNPWKQ